MIERFVKHWPAYSMGILVGVIFLFASLSFQVAEYESAVLIRFGRPLETKYESGLHFKWFYPIDRVWKEDRRIRSFSGKEGRLEEMQTADGKNVVVGVTSNWRIANEIEYIQRLRTIENGERELSSLLRSAKNVVIGSYALGDLINPNMKELKILEAESKMLKIVKEQAALYGIEVISVGFEHLGFPKEVSNSVFERMRSERQRLSQKYLGEGRGEAEKIKAQADAKASGIIAEAEAQAKIIRAEGDAEAAHFYSVFKKSPQLAIFLRKLEALKGSMGNNTTLILDTDSIPFDLLKSDSIENLLKPEVGAKPIVRKQSSSTKGTTSSKK
ncbi:MAG: protease modulator HflC [Lentisphaeria bacterium]